MTNTSPVGYVHLITNILLGQELLCSEDAMVIKVHHAEACSSNFIGLMRTESDLNKYNAQLLINEGEYYFGACIYQHTSANQRWRARH